MPRLKLDPIRARNLSNDYAKWLLQEQKGAPLGDEIIF